MKVYHYRNIETALLEISNGTFHFSSIEELNDPLEGDVNVYWKADKAAWEGLFCTYGISLFKSILNYFLEKYVKFNQNERARHIIKGEDQFTAIATKFDFSKELDSIYNAILNLPTVNKITNYCCYQNQNKKILRSVLIIFLYFVHLDIIRLCIKHLDSHGIMQQDDYDKTIDRIDRKSEFTKTARDRFLDLLSSNMDVTDVTNIFDNTYIQSFKVDFLSDLNLLLSLKQDINIFNNSKQWFNLETDYPIIFVDEISKLIFPESYVTCFSTSCNNSAMWGNYAHSHRGVCLIYEWSDSKKILEDPSFASQICCQEVVYNGDPLECNFFDYLHNLSREDIKLLLTGKNANLSSLFKTYVQLNKNDTLYKSFYETKSFRKLKYWSYENEYRIALFNKGTSSIPIENRNFKFHYNILKGVIFGINTSYYDKFRIVKSLKDLKDQLPQDFKVYQAYFDDNTHSLATVEINFRELLDK